MRRRRDAWSHNCVALGLAAGFMEPLESTSIHLIQSSIARLLNALPRTRICTAARTGLNRVTAAEWSQVREFLILHYKANGRVGEPFWDACRAMDIPASLAERVALFEEASIVIEPGVLSTDEAWTQVLIGQGVAARGWSPLADAVPIDDLAAYLDTLEQAYRHKVQALPTHAAFVQGVVGGAPSSLTSGARAA